MANQVQPNTRLAGRWLIVVRAAWVAIAGLAVGLFIAGTPARYTQLLAVTPAAATMLGQLRPEDAGLLAQVGLPLSAYAAYFTGLELLTALIVAGVAGLIFWGRSDDWMALFVSMNLITAATALPIVTVLETVHSGWTNVFAAASRALFALFAGGLVSFFYLFPNGRFVPRWTSWLTVVWLLYTVAWLFFPALQPPAGFGRGFTARDAPIILWIVIWLLSAVLAQIWRYRRVSDAIERQRTKWVVVGFASLVTLFVTGVLVLTSASLAHSGMTFLAARLTGPALIAIGVMALALSIGLSVLRYRLWDVDIIIHRTLVYSTLTLFLGLVYVGCVVLLRQVLTPLTGGSELAIVASTLAIAALVNPLRRRIQTIIDRRFYRRKYDAEKTLAAFSARMRDEPNLDALTADLLRVVDETMQPAHASLWLKQSTNTNRGE